MDVILNSLSKSYLLFLNHFRMMKPVVNYHGLLELLQIFKKDHQLYKEIVNLVEGSSSSSHRPFKKEKKKKNKKVPGAESQSQKSKFKAYQSQTECFFPRSRVTGRGTIHSILLPSIRTGQKRSNQLLDNVLM